MVSLLISIGIWLLISGACISSGVKNGSIIYGMLGFILSLVVISLLTRRKFKAINSEMQEVLGAGQKRIQHKLHQFQSKPGGNPRLIQKQLEADQHALFRQALDFTQKFEAYRKWNMLMGKQISTMRLQFLYQLKEFEEVDQIFAKNMFSSPILSDPLLVAMKMARQYMNKNIAGAEKTFKRYSRWYRDDRGAMLWGLMSWIYVKNGKVDDARELLNKAKDKMFNETLNRNWEMLANNREKSFSNSGFGDQWYSLYLENPPAPKQQRMRMNAKNAHRPF